MIYQKVGTGLYTCTGITGELEYPDSNWGMQESKSCTLPLGDTPSIIFISAVAIFSLHPFDLSPFQRYTSIRRSRVF